MNRRSFITKGAAGAALFSIMPREVLGKMGGNNSYIAPSDQLTRGLIGVGGIGRSASHFVSDQNCRLVALCDVDQKHLDSALSAAKQKWGEDLKSYHDFRELINDPNVDIVHIATPPHWHGLMSVIAANAGKDVFCEKPMTRTIGEGKRVEEAIKRNGRVFRLNTWFRFKDTFYGLGTEVKPLKKLVDSGLLGWPLKVRISGATGFAWSPSPKNSTTTSGSVRLPTNPTIFIVRTKPSAATSTTTAAAWPTWVSTTSTPCSTSSARMRSSPSRSRLTLRSSTPMQLASGGTSLTPTPTAARLSSRAKASRVRARCPTSRDRRARFTRASNARYLTYNKSSTSFPIPRNATQTSLTVCAIAVSSPSTKATATTVQPSSTSVYALSGSTAHSTSTQRHRPSSTTTKQTVSSTSRCVANGESSSK